VWAGCRGGQDRGLGLGLDRRRGLQKYFEKFDFKSVKKGEVRRGGKGEEASSASQMLQE
jgi:hypothetical protein